MHTSNWLEFYFNFFCRGVHISAVSSAITTSDITFSDFSFLFNCTSSEIYFPWPYSFTFFHIFIHQICLILPFPMALDQLRRDLWRWRYSVSLFIPARLCGLTDLHQASRPLSLHLWGVVYPYWSCQRPQLSRKRRFWAPWQEAVGVHEQGGLRLQLSNDDCFLFVWCQPIGCADGPSTSTDDVWGVLKNSFNLIVLDGRVQHLVADIFRKASKNLSTAGHLYMNLVMLRDRADTIQAGKTKLSKIQTMYSALLCQNLAFVKIMNGLVH